MLPFKTCVNNIQIALQEACTQHAQFLCGAHFLQRLSESENADFPNFEFYDEYRSMYLDYALMCSLQAMY